MKRFIFGTLTLLVVSGIGTGSWGTLGCGPAGLQLQAFAQPPSDWRYAQGDFTIAYLFKNGVQIGGYNAADGYWRDYDEKTDTWGDKVYCSRFDVPKHIGKSKDLTNGVIQPKKEGANPAKNIDLKDDKNMGVDWSKIDEGKLTYKGKEVPHDKVIQMIGADIPDHRKKFHLVVIGTEEQRKLVMDQFATMEPAISDRILTRSVRPNDFSLKDLMTGNVVYKQDGAPTVYFQSPNGTVLHRQNDPDQFVTAIRKAIKKYDADMDPDLRKPAPSPIPGLPSHPAIMPALAMGGFLLFALMKGKSR